MDQILARSAPTICYADHRARSIADDRVHVFGLDGRMMIFDAICPTPVVNCLSWAPFITCKAYFAVVLPNGPFINKLNVVDWTHSGADGASVTIVINANAFVRKGHKLSKAQLAVERHVGHRLQ